MNDPTMNDASQNERLDEVIAGYLESEQSGQSLDRQQLVEENSELADELRAFFADHDRMKAVAEPLRTADAPQSESAADAATLITSSESAAAKESGLPPTELDVLAAQRGKYSAARPGSVIRYFGDYELLSEIARGGMGVVYKARQVKLNRVVAMKMILAGQLASQEDVRRFYVEAEAAAKLSHPNIVPIFEVGQHEQQHYFSMGFVDGKSLAHRIAQGVLEPREAARLLKDVAGAIAYAHIEGVIHRDLKPGNILLEGFGVEGRLGLCPDRSGQGPNLPLIPRVTDFGLAKRVEGEASGLTVTGQILGTPSYMPPEQARGESAEVSQLSDVYSLGAVLYCLVTGRPPFQASNAVETLLQVMSREPVSPRQLNASVPLDLETIILKCLEKQPSRRYASAQHLVDELTRFLEGRPILARPVSAAERGWRWCRRHPAIAALTAGIAASLVIGTVVSWSFAMQADQQAREARRSEALAVREKKRADEQAEHALLNAKRADQQAQIAKANAARADEKSAEATANEKRANDEKLVSNRLLYVARMNFAQTAWEDTRIGETVRLLELSRPAAGQAGGPDDLRGFEWHYWNRLAHSYQLSLEGHTSSVMSVAFSPDGKRLASASDDQTVKVWDATSGAELLTLKGHTGTVRSVAFSPDGKRLASASMDQTVKVWDATSGAELHTLRGHTSAVASVAFSPDGKRLASAGSDVKAWDATSGAELLTLKGHTDGVNSVAFSPDGKWLASASSDRTVKVWDTTSGAKSLTLKGHTDLVWSVAFSPDGQRLAGAIGDPFNESKKRGEVKVWDATSGAELLTLKGHTDGVHSVAFSPDGKWLASASSDRTVKVWDATSGAESLTLKGHTHGVLSVAFSPDGKWLASASSDRTVKVWDATSGAESLTLKGHTHDVCSVAFSPDGKRLASASGEFPKSGEVKVWDATSGQETLTLKGHTNWVCSVAFSPDEKRLASASWDGTVKVWDATSGHEMLTLKGHTGRINFVAFSPDGKRLASASLDQTVKVWDATSGQETLTLKGHTNSVTSVAFSPDGKRLASAGYDLTVKVWDATPRP